MSCWFGTCWKLNGYFKEFFVLPAIEIVVECAEAPMVSEGATLYISWLIWYFAVNISWNTTHKKWKFMRKANAE